MLTGPRGGIVLTPSLEESYRFVNDYAPEHLEILSTDPFAHLGRITERRRGADGAAHADHVGNFVLGPNAVLPTSGWAHTLGPLSVTISSSALGRLCHRGRLSRARRTRADAADYEGFSSHYNAVSEMREKYLRG